MICGPGPVAVSDRLKTGDRQMFSAFSTPSLCFLYAPPVAQWGAWQQPAHPQLLGAADAQTAHPATFSTAPAHQPLGSANAEATPARAPAAAADRTQ